MLTVWVDVVVRRVEDREALASPRRNIAFTSRAVTSLSRSLVLRKRASTVGFLSTVTPAGALFPSTSVVLFKGSTACAIYSLCTPAMHPTLARLVRVVPRSTVDPALRPVPVPVRSDVVRPSLIEALQKTKEEAGADYPSNIRIEALQAKTVLRGLPRDARKSLAAMLKER